MNLIKWIFKSLMFEFERKDRRDYYRKEYLKSDAWKRKRYVVLRRDNWRCYSAVAVLLKFITIDMQKEMLVKNQLIGSS